MFGLCSTSLVALRVARKRSSSTSTQSQRLKLTMFTPRMSVLAIPTRPRDSACLRLRAQRLNVIGPDPWISVVRRRSKGRCTRCSVPVPRGHSRLDPAQTDFSIRFVGQGVAGPDLPPRLGFFLASGPSSCMFFLSTFVATRSFSMWSCSLLIQASTVA